MLFLTIIYLYVKSRLHLFSSYCDIMLQALIQTFAFTIRVYVYSHSKRL